MADVRPGENKEYRMLKSHELVLMREGTRLSGENPRSQVEIDCIRVVVWLGLEFSTVYVFSRIIVRRTLHDLYLPRHPS